MNFNAEMDDFQDRMSKVRSVATALRTSPMYVADIFGASPERIEKLLRSRGQWDDMLSIRENVEAHYGTRAVEAIEKAI